ncbi:MAG: hypothetical protein F2799_01000 [Actinobacteria bacterium]|uniref:Unannotated protein n=1 Tax=freshwater metagenome TaxID=449393 RepID=A0A6J7CUB7_9ZZZZ|nr:hypothetical protein [Actinomycetota bacterium]
MGSRGRAAGVAGLVAAGLLMAAPVQASTPTLLSGGLNTATSSLGLWLKVGTKTYKAGSMVSSTTAGNGTKTIIFSTSDPAKRKISVTLGAASGGIRALSAVSTGGPGAPDSIGIDFKAVKNERWFGFGERADMVSRGGTAGASTVENYVSDGPWQPNEWRGVGATLPPGGSRGRMDSTYFPVPWTLSTRGYGVLIDRNDTSHFTFGGKTAKTWSVDVAGGTLALRVFAGGTPAQTLALYTQTTGRQPAAAAPWYFGPWFQAPGDPATQIATLKSAGSPTSVSMTYSHYLPCGSDRGNEQSMINRANLWHGAGMAVTTYFNPMVCDTYSEAFDPASAAGALTKTSSGTPYVYRYVASQTFHVGQYDFSNPLGVSQFQGLLQRAVDHGYDGWMEDFGEYTPLDSVASDGTPAGQMHNVYPRLYHKAASDFAATVERPLARFQRSGWSGTAQYAQVVWGGDPSTDWGFDGLSSVVKNGIGMGLSGVSLWGSDIGGYFSLSSSVALLSEELLKRWVEVGFASGVMRNETDGVTASYVPRPQVTGTAVLPIWTKYSKLRTQMYPYLAAAQKQYDATGMPMMRALMLNWPKDAKAIAADDEYQFGPDLLVAPVLAAGATTRKAYLPSGSWVDLWRSARMNPSTGALEPTGSTVLAGGADRTVAAPIDQIPLFVKAGAAIPLISPDVWTLSNYGTGVVHLSDRQDQRRIVAFPRGAWTGALGPGETLSSTEGTNTWALAIGGSATRTYSIEAALGTLNKPFVPCVVKLGTATLPTSAWSYNATSKVLKVSATTRTGTVTAKSSCT